jgi:hypothetical protein
LIYLVVNLAIGSATNIEALAKCTFNSKGLQQSNRLSTVWFFSYFLILRYLQTFNLRGVFVASIIFFSVRLLIALYSANLSEPKVKIFEVLKFFVPNTREILGYVAALLLTNFVVQRFDELGKPMIGLGISAMIALLHFSLMILSNLSDLKKFKNLVQQ